MHMELRYPFPMSAIVHPHLEQTTMQDLPGSPRILGVIVDHGYRGMQVAAVTTIQRGRTSPGIVVSAEF